MLNIEVVRMSSLFNKLLGKTLTGVNVNYASEEITFITLCGHTYVQYHKQESDEDVYIKSVNGDLNCVLNAPILMAEEYCNEPSHDNLNTTILTFNKLATRHGYIEIYWNGNYNGQPSNNVEFKEIILDSNRDESNYAAS